MGCFRKCVSDGGRDVRGWKKPEYPGDRLAAIKFSAVQEKENAKEQMDAGMLNPEAGGGVVDLRSPETASITIKRSFKTI